MTRIFLKSGQVVETVSHLTNITQNGLGELTKLVWDESESGDALRYLDGTQVAAITNFIAVVKDETEGVSPSVTASKP